MEAARYLVALLLLTAPLAALPEGITFDLGNTVAVIGNPSGGLRQGIVYSGSTYLDVLFDLEKLARFDDLIFHASFCVRQGQSLTSEYIGNAFPVQQNYGTPTYQLNLFCLEQKLLKGKMLLKVGRLNAGDDFLTDELYYNFVSGVLNQNPFSIFYNVPFSAFPNASWGGYIEYSPNISLKFKYGFYNTDDQIYLIKYHGLHWTFNSAEGMLHVAQAEYEGAKVGIWAADSDWGLYLHADHELICEITGFAAALISPEKCGTFPYFFAAGLCGRGTAFSVSYGYGDPGYSETVIELNHAFKVNPHFLLQPVLQIIVATGIPTATVLGIQSTTDF